MAYADSLIKTARKLANSPPKKPRRSDLNRAVSTAYYAVFDALLSGCASMLLGNITNPPNPAWVKVYRSVGHTEAKGHLEKAAKTQDYGTEIALFSKAFSKLQALRHNADYDPSYRLSRAAALRLVNEAEDALHLLASAPNLQKQRLAIDLIVKGKSVP